MTTLLLVEDEAAQRRTLSIALESRGYSVVTAPSGVEALAALEHLTPDLVLLDLGLPDMDGLTVCTRMRVWLHCPIIVVSGDAVEERMVEALDRGADDYVVKPYSMPVLLARVRVSLRHAATAAAIAGADRFECGDLRLDVPAHEVTVDGRPVDMQARQFALLTLLLRQEGKVVTYSTLAKAMWGHEPDAPDLNSLRIAVSRIRTLIGTGPRRPVIHTEVRVGYRLTGPDDANDHA